MGTRARSASVSTLFRVRSGSVIIRGDYAPINVKPQRGGGGSGIGGAFDFLTKFSIKCPTVGQ